MCDCRAESGIRIPNRGIRIPNRCARMSATIYGAVVARALQAKYGERRHAAKLLAAVGEATERAARNWMSGTCGPQAAVLIRLMAREPDVAEAVQALVEQQRQLDAELAARKAPRHPGARAA